MTCRRVRDLIADNTLRQWIIDDLTDAGLSEDEQRICLRDLAHSPDPLYTYFGRVVHEHTIVAEYDEHKAAIREELRSLDEGGADIREWFLRELAGPDSWQTYWGRTFTHAEFAATALRFAVWNAANDLYDDLITYA